MSPREQEQLFVHAESSDSLATLEEVDDAKPQTATVEPHEPTKVRFSTIQMRTYNRIAGDHPDVIVGPPLTFDWESVQHEPELLDDYEKNRKPMKRVLRLSSVTRKNILRNVFEISDEEIIGAEKEIQKIRKSRERTNKQTKTGAKVESAFKKARRKIFGGVSKEVFLKGLLAASGTGLWIHGSV